MLRRKPVYGLSILWRMLFFAVLGATMGTVLDALHVWSGTAGYRGVALLPFLNVAWYVPLEFAVAGTVVGLLRPELDEELNRRRSDLPEWKVVLSMVYLVVVWASSGLLGKAGLENDAIGALLLAVAVVNWITFDRTPQGAFAALLTAMLGVMVEAGVALTGTYYYTHPDIFGVPAWLPALYLTACVSVGNLGRYMKYSWDRPPDEPEEEEAVTPQAKAA
jgi:hypothetical protein